MQPRKVSDLAAYQSPWLKASDLQGRSVAVVVEKVTVEEVRQQDGSKEAKIVVSFMGKAKRLIANKTQALTIADIARTEEFERWSGLSVILEPAKTRNGQETINIRRAARAQASQPGGGTSSTTPPTQDDDNPFFDDTVGERPGA